MSATNHMLTTGHQSARLPIILDRKKIRIRPTRNGLIFIVLVLAMFLGSLNYNNNLGFILTFLLGSLAFVSIAHTYKNVAGITFGSSFAQSVFAGQKAVFEFIIPGDTATRVRIGFGFRDCQIAYYDLTAHEDNRVRVLVGAPTRGVLNPGPLRIHSDYPLGLFQVGTRIDPDLECLIYPIPQAGKVRIVDARSADGDDVAHSAPGSDDFQGLKGYTPGDSLQRISWKASSRGQGLFTKDFTGRYRSTVFLDWHSLGTPDPEDKLSLLCHMVLNAYQNDVTYGLRLPGTSIQPGNGRGHRIRCLKALALY
jgi:uncharacterized protein (DUF58 family)